MLQSTEGNFCECGFFLSPAWHGVSGTVTLVAVLSEVLVIMLSTVPSTKTAACMAFRISFAPVL